MVWKGSRTGASKIEKGNIDRIRVDRNNPHISVANEIIRARPFVAVKHIPTDSLQASNYLLMGGCISQTVGCQQQRGACTHWLSKVKRDGWLLQHAPDHIRNDKNIVLAAVQQDGRAMAFATPELRGDKDIVLAAVRENPDNIKFALEKIKLDPEVLTMAGIFQQQHPNKQERNRRKVKKIVLSTRFSMNPSSISEATNFTYLLNNHEYIRTGDFDVYAPNGNKKCTCDPNWTNFYHPCRGTTETCQMQDVSLRTGSPTDDSCWRYSFRHQLQEAKDTNGIMLQLVERGSFHNSHPKLGDGQKIERDMAKYHLKLKTFQVVVPMGLGSYDARIQNHHIAQVITAIKEWYDDGCQDMSKCVVRTSFW